MKFVKISMLTLLLVFASAILPAAEMRQWTGSNGKIIEAEFLGLDGDIVKLKLKNGKESNVPISLFSKQDQEFIKKTGTIDNPFDNGVTADADDPEKFTKPEKVRFTLEMSEKGRAKLRVEKVDGEPKQTFDGKVVTLPGFPKLDVKTRPDGTSHVVYDCRSPLPTSLLYQPMNVELDSNAGKLTLRPNVAAKPNDNTDGWCRFGLKQIMRLPMKISFYATVTHRGECCNLAMLFSDVF